MRVAATFEIPDAGAMALAHKNVKQTGREVEFGIRVAQASFLGALNQESIEMSGQWSQEGGNTTLTLQRKQG